MKKTKLIKLFLMLLIMSIMVIMFNTNVLAVDNTFNDLTGTLNTPRTNNANTNNSNTNTNNTNTANTNNANTNNSNTNSASIYNTNNLPQTGIEDSIPIALLVVVFGISSIYAYKKIKDYRNI